MNFRDRVFFAINGAVGMGCFMFAAVGATKAPGVILLAGEANLVFALFHLSAAFRRSA